MLDRIQITKEVEEMCCVKRGVTSGRRMDKI